MDTHTDRLIDAKRFYNLSHAICYSYEADNNILYCIILSAGTTDHPCKVTDNPTPSEAEIQFILKEIRNYLSPDVNGL